MWVEVRKVDDHRVRTQGDDWSTLTISSSDCVHCYNGNSISVWRLVDTGLVVGMGGGLFLDVFCGSWQAWTASSQTARREGFASYVGTRPWDGGERLSWSGTGDAIPMHCATCSNTKGVTCGIKICRCRHPDFAATPSGLVAVSLVYELRTQAQLDKAGIVILHP